jgi:hypothetical protein
VAWQKPMNLSTLGTASGTRGTPSRARRGETPNHPGSRHWADNDHSWSASCSSPGSTRPGLHSCRRWVCRARVFRCCCRPLCRRLSTRPRSRLAGSWRRRKFTECDASSRTSRANSHCTPLRSLSGVSSANDEIAPKNRPPLRLHRNPAQRHPRRVCRRSNRGRR